MAMLMNAAAGLLGLGSGVLKLLLRIPPQWQTVTAFPIGLTEETLISEPIFKALYDVTSLKPFDQVDCEPLRFLLAAQSLPVRASNRKICKLVMCCQVADSLLL